MKYLIFFVLWSNIVCSQISEGKYTIGITNHNINYLESDFNLNFGCFYDKNYSQINLMYAVTVNSGNSGGIWSIEESINKRSGIGYTHRYFPNKKYSLFTSFIEANVSYLSISANTTNYGFDSVSNVHTPESIKRNILNLYLGYGVGLNFLHHFSIMHSIGGGYSFVGGENHYVLTVVLTERYQNNETFLQINFSVLYHLYKF